MGLTIVRCSSAKPQSKPYKLFDEKGMFLLVQPNGGKYWRMKYRFGGKEKLLALGVYPEVSLKKAREKRDQAKSLLIDRKDPSRLRRLELEAEKNTFESIAKEWVESRRNGWSKDHADRVLASLQRDVFPELGSRPVAKITPLELLGSLRKIESRGALEYADRLLQRCSAVFRYAIATGRCEGNPAAELRGALKTPKRQNYAALAATELPEFLTRLEKYDGQLQTKLAVKLLLLTFVRTAELRGAEFLEFDKGSAEWRIPPERMKMKKEHIVPLSRQAVAVLEQLQALNAHGRLVFPNQANPEKYMSENTILYALYRVGYHARATGHGFRTTASTILNEMGFHPDAIERQLAHSDPDKVRGVYNKAEYLPERRRMMQVWADHLEGLTKGV